MSYALRREPGHTRSRRHAGCDERCRLARLLPFERASLGRQDRERYRGALLFDAAMKVFKLPAAVDGTVQLGYPAGVLVPLGIIQIVCLILYLIPRVSPLGAVLWTGYLGGAVATHVRLGNPLFTHVLFPTYVATLLWVGLWLRDPRVRALLTPRAR